MKPKPSADKMNFEAIGTHWWLEALSGTISHTLRQKVLGYAEQFNRLYSRFIDNSLVGKLNRGYAVEQPPQELLDMLSFSKEMYEISNGVFDITVGGILHKHGYGKKNLAAYVNKQFWNDMTMNKSIVAIPAKTTIDFGGLGKGWMIDAIAQLFRENAVGEFIINGGGDMYVEAISPIEIFLEHPYKNEQKIGSTYIMSGGLGVSSMLKRKWKDGESEYHHLIDPRTGQPSKSTVACSYVRAGSALLADTMASILLIEPSLNQALSKRYGLKTILIDKSQLNLPRA